MLESDHTTANPSGRPTTEARLSLPPVVVVIANASVTGNGAAPGSAGSCSIRPDSTQLSPLELHTCQAIMMLPSDRLARPALADEPRPGYRPAQADRSHERTRWASRRLPQGSVTVTILPDEIGSQHGSKNGWQMGGGRVFWG